VDSEKSWVNGVRSYSSDLTNFMGRFGNGARVYQTFVLPKNADGLYPTSETIKFDLYQIDNWQAGDSISIVIGFTEISLGDFSSGGDGFVSGNQDGISWWRDTISHGTDLGFQSVPDKKHIVEMAVPSSYFLKKCILHIEFKIVTSSGYEDQSAGIDEFSLTSHYECVPTTSPTRSPTIEATPVASPVASPVSSSGSMGCETAWAYSPSAICFLDMSDITANRWGWSIGPLSEGSAMFDIYAAAGQCDLNKGTYVGSLYVDYSNGVATVEYEMVAGFHMEEIHLYVGSTVVNEVVQGGKVKKTVAPGSFPDVRSGLTSVSETVLVSGLSGDVYINAHAVVCGGGGDSPVSSPVTGSSGSTPVATSVPTSVPTVGATVGATASPTAGSTAAPVSNANSAYLSGCETAWAFSSNNPDSTCFMDISGISANRWGWSVGPISAGVHRFDIYAAAGGCDLGAGTLVGTLRVVYSGDTATVTYQVYSGVHIEETHFYVGSKQIFEKKQGKKYVKSVAPGSFNNIQTGLQTTAVSDSVSGLSGDIYVMAHAVVCGDNRRELEDVDNCEGEIEVANEDFEDGSVSGWSNGLVANLDGLGRFLGRLGEDNPDVSKRFTIPFDGASMTVAFSFYEIGTWDESDCVSVTVGSTKIILGDLRLDSGCTDKVQWTRKMASGVTGIKKHLVSVSVPGDYFLGKHIDVSVEVALHDIISKRSAGIDDVVVTVHGVCDMTGAKMVESTVDSEEESYCLSADFPCGEDNMVHICHYSTYKGYKTFCVPEKDSEMTQFFANDYCGPCVGGYGSGYRES